jgi:RimJ/RimL family protein N-acetyltransferase
MHITFRPLTRSDLPLLHEWLTRPHVAEWWGEQGTLAELEEEYGPDLDGQTSTRVYIAMEDGRDIGFIQSYVAIDSADRWWADERDPGVRGIDQFLANVSDLGHGRGTAMIRAFVEMLYRDPAVTRIQTDPQPDNARAIRCYEKAGFRAMREVDTPDGRALLMVCERP